MIGDRGGTYLFVGDLPSTGIQIGVQVGIQVSLGAWAGIMEGASSK